MGFQRLFRFSQRPSQRQILFRSGDRPVGWGSSTRRVVSEKFVPSLESLSSLGFEEGNLACPGNLAGMSRTPGGVQKVCAKKVRVHPFKGPFRTKNNTALEAVSVPFSCLFLLEKITSISEHSPYRFAIVIANLVPVPKFAVRSMFSTGGSFGPKKRLSVLLPLIALPLELSPLLLHVFDKHLGIWIRRRWSLPRAKCDQWTLFRNTPNTAGSSMTTALSQGALKGTNLKGQTEPKSGFSLIFADSRLSLEVRTQSIWKTQNFAENRRFSQKTAENCQEKL